MDKKGKVESKYKKMVPCPKKIESFSISNQNKIKDLIYWNFTLCIDFDENDFFLN